MYTVTTPFRHNESKQTYNMTVVESYVPSSAGKIMAENLQARATMRQLATDLLNVGPGSVKLKSEFLSQYDFLVTLDVDLSKNKPLIRNLDAIVLASRIGAAFGKLPEGVEGEPLKRRSFTGPTFLEPNTSLAGDVCRMVGVIVGYSADMLLHAIWRLLEPFLLMFSASSAR